MDLLEQVFEWFTTTTTWTGSGIDPGIIVRVTEHVQMSSQAVALAAIVAMPVGLYVGHTRRFEFAAVTVGNLGRALPSFGVLGLVFPFTFSLPGTLGYWPTFIALLLLAIPPILTNTYVGIKGVDRDTVEAARGMGMTERELLLRLELPLAAPLIVAGLRIAAVQVVATATLGAVASWGGLGRYIVDGFAASDEVQILGGAILVAGLAVVTEGAFAVVGRVVAPRLASRRGRARLAPRRGPQPGTAGI